MAKHKAPKMPADTAPIRLGDKVKDILTGFVGIAIGRTRWLHACDRITVEPDSLGTDGQPQKSQTFDEQRIELIRRNVIPARMPMVTLAIPLGANVRDSLNGFSGIAVSITTWVSGEIYYSIEPDTLDEKGQPRGTHSCEANRVVLVEARPVPASRNAMSVVRTGGPQRGEEAALRRRGD